MQKRARNLAAEELSIEIISGGGGDDFPVIQGLNIPFTDVTNIKSTLEVMMFGRGSAFPLPSTNRRSRPKVYERGLLNHL